MKMSLTFLKEILSNSSRCNNKFLMELLNSPTLDKEYSGRYEEWNVGFALSRAKSRLEFVKKNLKTSYGIVELIPTLEQLDESAGLIFVYLEDNNFLGTCFILNEELIGYEFILKEGTLTEPYSGGKE